MIALCSLLLVCLGDLLFDATLYKDAIAEYKRENQACSNLIWANYYEKNYQEVLKLIPYPKTEEENTLCGLCHLHLENKQQAIECLKKANNPHFLAIAYYLNSEPEMALPLFQQGNDPFWHARGLIALHRLSEAKEVLNPLNGKEKDLLMAKIALEEKDFEKVRTYLEKRHEFFQLGIFELEVTSRLDLAKKHLLKAWERKKNGQTYLALSSCLAKQNEKREWLALDTSTLTNEEKEEGIVLFATLAEDDTVLKNSTQTPKVLFARGELALKHQDPVTALDHFEKLPHTSQVQIKKGECFSKMQTRQGWESAYKAFCGVDENRAKLALSELALLDATFIPLARNELKEDTELLALLEEKLQNKEAAYPLYLKCNKLMDAARCAPSKEVEQSLLQEVVKRGGQDAAEAYFHTFDWDQYFCGKKETIEHLKAMPIKYPDSPYLIAAHYLLGVHAMAPKEKGGQKRVGNEAVDHFFKALELFERLPQETRSLFEPIATKAKEERALHHYQIAKEAHGAKKTVFLQEAKHLFKELSHPKATYFLALCHLELKEESQARELFNSLKEKEDPWKFRAQLELAKLDLETDPQRALEYLEGLQGVNIASHDRLEMLLVKADILQKLGDEAQAMLCLSAAVNDPSISSLRIKAMLKRADIYKKQGRDELCKKQLASVIKLGGPFSKEATLKLESYYD
jgi:hypothetical protein